MGFFLSFIIICNALAFLFYGFNCLFSTKLKEEFLRFQLTETQRKITGLLQILGAIGLISGLFFTKIGFLASLGLALLMLCGFVVRLKIKDSFLQAAPSFGLMLLNGYLAYIFWNII